MSTEPIDHIRLILVNFFVYISVFRINAASSRNRALLSLGEAGYYVIM